MQEKTTEKKDVDVRAYYRSLQKKEKGQLLKYLFMRYDFNPRTFQFKLSSPDSLIKRSEREIIQEVIVSESWRA